MDMSDTDGTNDGDETAIKSVEDMTSMERVTEELNGAWRPESGFDMDDDLHYLLSLIGEAMGDDEVFEDDSQRAKWAISQWVHELRYTPDLSEYAIEDPIPPGEVPPSREMNDERN